MGGRQEPGLYVEDPKGLGLGVGGGTGPLVAGSWYALGQVTKVFVCQFSHCQNREIMVACLIGSSGQSASWKDINGTQRRTRRRRCWHGVGRVKDGEATRASESRKLPSALTQLEGQGGKNQGLGTPPPCHT